MTFTNKAEFDGRGTGCWWIRTPVGRCADLVNVHYDPAVHSAKDLQAGGPCQSRNRSSNVCWMPFSTVITVHVGRLTTGQTECLSDLTGACNLA